MKRTVFTVFSIAIAGTVFGSAVHSHAAAPLATGVLPSAIANANTFLCQAVNVSLKPLEVTLEIIDTADGSVVGTNTATVAPSGSLNAISITSVNQFCRATGLTAKTGRITFTAVSGNTPLMHVTAP
jgi:hypothetical protein